jgi:3-oxoacyl-[acyl-carrier protein] reductase
MVDDDGAGLLEALTRAHGTLDSVDSIVYVPGGCGGIDQRPIALLDPAEWDRFCEQPLRRGIAFMQSAYRITGAERGRIVVIIPTVALTGMAGMAPFASACEGLRGMAKSAARAWGARGISVNCVAVPLDLLGITAGPESRVPTRWPSALSAPTIRDVASLVLMLSSDRAGCVTGSTISVDGGSLMAP